MKKFLTMIVVLTVMYSAVVANAIDKPKSPVGTSVIKSGSVFKLFYKGTRPSDVTVTILDEKGTAVYKETLRNVENFMRPYNFSSLKEGEYTIELNHEDGKQLQKISYHNAVATAQKKLMNLLRVPGTEKYMLRVSNKGNETLKVSVFDAKHALVYSGTEKIDGDFAKIYDMNEVGQGFVIEVTDQNGITQSLSGK
jgi:hypothetical protein